MPTYQKFEELPVWQSSAEIYDRLDDVIDRAPPRVRAAFRAKLEQAALTLSSNVAEAFMRPGKQALPFLDAAHVAAAEVQSLASIAARQPYLKDMRGELDEVRKLAESCSRQIWGWAEMKQNPGGRNGGQPYQRPPGKDDRSNPAPERDRAPAATRSATPARGR